MSATARPHSLDRTPVVAAIRPLHREGLGAQADQQYDSIALNFSQ